jgi:hypothetical protein
MCENFENVTTQFSTNDTIMSEILDGIRNNIILSNINYSADLSRDKYPHSMSPVISNHRCKMSNIINYLSESHNKIIVSFYECDDEKMINKVIFNGLIGVHHSGHHVLYTSDASDEPVLGLTDAKNLVNENNEYVLELPIRTLSLGYNKNLNMIKHGKMYVSLDRDFVIHFANVDKSYLFRFSVV